MSSMIDLTTVEEVKVRAEVTSTADDAEIQSAITGFSRYLLNRSGLPSLNSVVQMDEIRDGNGNNRMMLTAWPGIAVNSVAVCGVSIPLSTSTTTYGAFLEQGGRSIALRGGVGQFSTFPYPTSRYSSRRGPVFLYGTGNIELVYTAGFPNGVPEDLEYAVRCVVAINYKRKSWQDMQSKTVSAGPGMSATTRYRDWMFPPEYCVVFDYYRRVAII